MTPPMLLPRTFVDDMHEAVHRFWAARDQGTGRQSGGRAQVIGGKHLDGFVDVVRTCAAHVGLPAACVFAGDRHDTTLPGYFRATKAWDVVIVHRRRLVAALELKSHVGSFGNNLNNRSEEAIGNAVDLWAAFERGAIGPDETLTRHEEAADPRRPFVGYMMLLEDCDEVFRAVTPASPHFAALGEFRNSSYSGRYRLLCERLMERGLYTAAALILSGAEEGRRAGTHRSLTEATAARSLFVGLAAQMAAAAG